MLSMLCLYFVIVYDCLDLVRGIAGYQTKSKEIETHTQQSNNTMKHIITHSTLLIIMLCHQCYVCIFLL